MEDPFLCVSYTRSFVFGACPARRNLIRRYVYVMSSWKSKAARLIHTSFAWKFPFKRLSFVSA
jgi:hypothetical protein